MQPHYLTDSKPTRIQTCYRVLASYIQWSNNMNKSSMFGQRPRTSRNFALTPRPSLVNSNQVRRARIHMCGPPRKKEIRVSIGSLYCYTSIPDVRGALVNSNIAKHTKFHCFYSICYSNLSQNTVCTMILYITAWDPDRVSTHIHMRPPEPSAADPAYKG